MVIRIGNAGSVAEPFKLQKYRKNARAAVRFVISKISPATLLNAVGREILIRSFDVSAVTLGNSFQIQMGSERDNSLI